MSSINDETLLKQSLEEMIAIIQEIMTEELSYLNEVNQYNEKNELMDKMTILMNNKFKKLLQSLSHTYREYFLDLFNDYHYDFHKGEFSESFKSYILEQLCYDLRAIRDSFDAFQAAFIGNLSIVEQFVSAYPTYKDKSGFWGTTLLYSASRNNHIDIVQYLIEEGKCSVNAQNQRHSSKSSEYDRLNPTDGSTALHAACYNGHLDIVKYLIDSGGNYFIKNNAKETPIHNGQLRQNIQAFFQDFLIYSYTNSTNKAPESTILEDKNQDIIDCIWEYKPLNSDQWITFVQNQSNQLHQSLIFQQNRNYNEDIPMNIDNQLYNISIIQFLSFNKSNKDHLWIRCRGSSILNFDCYSIWQIMFEKHFAIKSNKSSTYEVYKISDDSQTQIKIQLNCWYTSNQYLNEELNNGINIRRKLVKISLPFLNNDLFEFNLKTFSFSNYDKTIKGFIRWIPTFILTTTSTIIDNFQPLNHLNVIPLIRKDSKKAFTSNGSNFNQIKHSEILHNEDEHVSMVVCFGDLIQETSDVIVVCWSSKHLLGMIYESGGSQVRTAINNQMKNMSKDCLITVKSDGDIKSKRIYFVQFEAQNQLDFIQKSIENIISISMQKAHDDRYSSIAFPAIACGDYQYPIHVVAQTMINKTHQEQILHKISAKFVIHPNKSEIYKEFSKQIRLLNQSSSTEFVSTRIQNSLIQIEKGDITKQNVDVIVVSSSSDYLRQIVIMEGGEQVYQAYEKENETNPNSLLICTPPGNLSCKKIFFLKWKPDENENILRQSIIDFIWNVIQNTLSYQFDSIAFPSMGFGHYNISTQIIIQTMIQQIIYQIKNRNLLLTIKVVILPDQHHIYQLFSKQLLTSEQDEESLDDDKVPSTWELSAGKKFRFFVSHKSDEYKSIVDEFQRAIKGKMKNVLKIERIQNERWYFQYLAHKKEFFKRLKKNSEQRLYHGCPENVVNSIIEDCFNRSFAGVNGTSYGLGVYFSSDATYSHQFSKPNSNGERCMFVARVLIGNTTLGNSSMKTRPPGFDTTTDGNHIFVTYHDAQAYAEYLIYYK